MVAHEGVSIADGGVSVTNEGVLMTNEGVSVANEGVSVANEGVSMTNEGVSMTNEGVSVIDEGVSMTNEGGLMTNEGGSLYGTRGGIFRMAQQAELDQVLPSVRAFLRAVASLFPVEAAYIFGSYARGTASPDSDIDVAVVSSAFSGDRFDDNAALARLTWGIDTRIEPVALRSEALASGSPLAAAIHLEGVSVSREADAQESEALVEHV